MSHSMAAKRTTNFLHYLKFSVVIREFRPVSQQISNFDKVRVAVRGAVLVKSGFFQGKTPVFCEEFPI